MRKIFYTLPSYFSWFLLIFIFSFVSFILFREQPHTGNEEIQLEDYISARESDERDTKYYIVWINLPNLDPDTCKKVREANKGVANFQEVHLTINGDTIDLTCQEFLDIFKKIKMDREFKTNVPVGSRIEY